LSAKTPDNYVLKIETPRPDTNPAAQRLRSTARWAAAARSRCRASSSH